MGRSRYYVTSNTPAHSPRPKPHSHRPALAPRLPAKQAAYATTFHRALDRFNAKRGTAFTYDELTQHQQLIVREIAKQIEMVQRPCRRLGSSR